MIDRINYSHFLDLLPITGRDTSGSRLTQSEQDSTGIEGGTEIHIEAGSLADEHPD